MRSKPSAEGLAALRNMPELARSELFHVYSNGSCIVSGIAQLLQEHPDENVRARAKTIVRTMDTLTQQLKQMTTGHDDTTGVLAEVDPRHK